MTSSDSADRLPILQGTLDLLVLRILGAEPQHGQGIARAIQRFSGDRLLVDHGSLYPALRRLERSGWIAAEWGVSSNNRRARFYRLTPVGERQLMVETGRFRGFVEAVQQVFRQTGGSLEKAEVGS